MTTLTTPQFVIGEATNPWGNNGAWFREVAVFNASALTERAFVDFDARVSRDGARLNVTFRGNTQSAPGIDPVTGPRLVRQILHLSGHSRHPEAFAPGATRKRWKKNLVCSDHWEVVRWFSPLRRLCRRTT